MKFSADFHIHSRFSRATSKTLDFEKLYIAAQLKGITVVGTADFTHPTWFKEIEQKLEPAEPGLFRLKKDIARQCDKEVPRACRQKVRFLLTTEISCIYKKNERTRKNHNLIFLPDTEAVARFNKTLDKVGNIRSDGRPILGLDAKHLLEILLETDDSGYLVPAHIWTPWFSVLGSKSGFDSIDECFEDLTTHIFALETGLSSDPPMNWRISSLDRFTMISNSDAHSPHKLGREANLFDTDLSYFSVLSAIRSGTPDRFLGTLEFYPEEGKYHLDGHRKCNLRLKPEETVRHKGNCPECGRPLTLGVLYRVTELADRIENYRPENRPSVYNLIPLTEVLSEILASGPQTKRVQKSYLSLLNRFGPELNILMNIDVKELEAAGLPLVGVAIQRMRQGNIDLSPGYDGVFGKIKIFGPGERNQLLGQSPLFGVGRPPGPPPFTAKKAPKYNFEKPVRDIKPTAKKSKRENVAVSTVSPAVALNSETEISPLRNLNPEQQRAVTLDKGPAIVVAGPGTGKTLTLTRRISFLIEKKKVSPERILAVTFTNKAAEEMQRRLKNLMDPQRTIPTVATFHSFCFNLLREMRTESDVSIVDDTEKGQWMAWALKMALKEGGPINRPVREIIEAVAVAKQNLISPEELYQTGDNSPMTRIVAIVYRNYQRLLSLQKRCDYEDLIYRVVMRLESDPDTCTLYRKRYDHILVDEYQDLNYGQYRLLNQLSPAGEKLFVIGDPDQSIYGFRGSDSSYFNRFLNTYHGANLTRLTRNYRSTQTILNAAHQLMSVDKPDVAKKGDIAGVYSGIDGKRTVSILETHSDRAEAVAVGKKIERLIGGIAFDSIDFGRVDGTTPRRSYGFSDFAILYRTRSQGQTIAEIMQKVGIPCQTTNKAFIMNKQGAILLISWMKVIHGVGSYLDLERVVSGLGLPVSRPALERFFEWAIQFRIDLAEALYRVVRLPLKSIKREDQKRLAQFSRQNQALCDQLKKHGLQQQLKILFDRLPSVFIEKNPVIVTEFERLLDLTDDGERDPSGFFTRFDLQTDTDLYDEKSQKVALMTMHAAKGLEFPVVFITGCEADLIPHKTKDGQFSDMAEERRLFYVAMTRAKERLYITYAMKRRIFGRYQQRRPSPFINDIEQRLKTHEAPGRRPSPGVSRGSDRQVQLKLF
jgi:uncharacterized protein (TIGR00375 family)